MALRTINAPGVEIKEIDKSDYSPNLTGSHILVAGFADRGQDFITHDITSRNTWINVYGEPTNEAERYFYKASMEVINNGGTLHCAKIPYTNAISADYIEQIFKVNVEGQPLSSDPYLSAVSDVDPTIQKFFLVTSGLQEDVGQELANLLKAKYIQNKELIDSLITDLENGGSTGSQTDAMEVFNDIMSELNPDPSTSRAALHAQVLKNFDETPVEESKASGDLDAIKKILYSNLKKTVTWDPDDLRDFGAQREWLANLKYEFENAKAQAAGKAGDIKKVVTDFSNTFLPAIEVIKYKIEKAAKKEKKAVKEGTVAAEEPEEEEPVIEYISGADSSNEESEILIELLKALFKAASSGKRRSNVIRMSEQDYEDYATGEKIPALGQIHIVDISRTKYGKAVEKRVNDPYMKECLGYMAVITTASNAMYCQQLLDTDVDGAGFNIVSDIRTLDFSYWGGTNFPYTEMQDNCFVLENDELAVPTSVVGTCDESYALAYRDSLTMRANAYFPALFFDSGTKVNREHLKEIGIVVFKTFVNRNDSSKMDFEVVEAFTGNLDPKAVNPSTSASTFIDNIVNNQSEYIRCYSNVVTDNNRAKYNNCDIGYIHNQAGGITGIYEDMTIKKITFNGITSALDKIFDINSDINAKTIDVVVDAGISNIAQFVKIIAPDAPDGTFYDPTGPGAAMFKMNKSSLTANWKFIIEKYDNFCRKTRKDCMFIADCPRPFALVGKKKTVRESRKDTNIDTTIIPLLRYMAASNTSYGAGYSNWFEETDDFTGNQFWCPPSIRASGIYVNCDLNYNYWDAPAGLTRGLISANDVAFNPNLTQAGNIYLKNWNYAIKYPDDGIVLEGQKTFQTRASAFDRVNVRRLFLRLERYVYRQARYFVYEPNTALTRQRLVDRITPYFKEVQTKGGMYDFRIICDETINTPDVIDNNELRVVIGIKPTKTIEFIIIQFVALRTGGSWEELDHV